MGYCTVDVSVAHHFSGLGLASIDPATAQGASEQATKLCLSTGR